MDGQVLIESNLTNNENAIEIVSIVDKLFSGFEGDTSLRLVVLVFVLAIVLFMAISVVVLYIKSFLGFVSPGSGKRDSVKISSSSAGAKSGGSLEEDDEDADDLGMEFEDELEKELERELEMQAVMQKNLEWNPGDYTSLTDKSPRSKNIKEREKIELDWDKNIKSQVQSSVKVLSDVSYKPQERNLKDYISLAVDMLSNGVGEFKVAQTLMYKSQNNCSEYDVLQMIDSLNSFATLCAKGSFREFGIDEEEAVVGLMSGDVSQALLLIERLMDLKIDIAANAQDGKARDILLEDTSNLANLFATLASLSDDELALGALELSLEVYPENINSWSKIGDIYQRLGQSEKAKWAYENVLALSVENEYQASVANSQDMLSQLYYAEGNTDQAEEMYNQSKMFYDMIGINRNLDRHEIDVIDSIEENQNKESHSEAAARFLQRTQAV